MGTLLEAPAAAGARGRFAVGGVGLAAALVASWWAGDMGAAAMVGGLVGGGLAWLVRGTAPTPVKAPSEEVEALRARVAELEQALRREEGLLEAAPVGVVLVGASGLVVVANRVAQRLLAARRNPVGMRPIEVFHVAELQEAVDRARGADPRDADPGGGSRALHAAVGDVDVVIEVAPVDGGAMVIVRDETEQRLVERARTDFVANVSHELRTPIAAIQGYAELLEDEPSLTPDARGIVAVIQRNGRRLSALFDDLLTLYRIETRRQQLPRQVMELGPILEDAVASAVDQALARSIGFELTCAEGLSALVNREALVTIVANLANNAVKFTPDSGHVWVRAREDEGSVLLEVADDGVGVPRHHHERIFERFYRVDEGRSRELGGTGLGLAIVKHLALAMEASVGLRSDEGQGSTFWVRLPRAAAEHAPRTWDV
jgi:two-component system phosphate regulon sensor histidine kinase PhoR